MTPDDAMGLPPGLKYVRIGSVKIDEKYYQDGKLLDGPRPGTNIVVKLLPGWEAVYDINTDSNVPAQTFNPPQEVTLRLRASNSLQLSDIMSLKQRLKERAGILIEDEAEKPSEPVAEPSESPAELDGGEPPATGAEHPESGQPSASPPGH